MNKAFPYAAASLGLSTVVASMTVATIVTGVPWGTVRILQLRDYGGVDNAQLVSGEWWRLLTAQFVHVKPAHMLFNVVTLFLLGMCVERCVGAFRLVVLWLSSGVIGTYASIYSVPRPYDIGSGASQALVGLAGAAVVILFRRLPYPRWLPGVLVVTLAVTTGLDLVSSSGIKLGHIVGFLVGLVVAVGVVPNPGRRVK